MEASAERVVVTRRGPRRIGPVVTFSGVEGSKKTVMSVEAANLLRSRGWKVRMLRSYPLSLYSPSDHDGKDHAEELVDDRAKGGAAGFAFRLFARFVFMADLALMWLSMSTRGGRGTALVYDRYAHDALVQLRRTGIIGDREFRFWASMIPAPDVAFWLRTKPGVSDVGVSKERVEEFEKRTALYASIADKARFQIVDTDNEKRAREEVRGILAHLERNW